MAGNSGDTRMKTVFIVMGWQTGEEEFISGVFGDEHSAEVYAERMEYEDEYNYQYKVHEWEVK